MDTIEIDPHDEAVLLKKRLQITKDFQEGNITAMEHVEAMTEINAEEDSLYKEMEELAGDWDDDYDEDADYDDDQDDYDMDMAYDNCF